MLLTLIVSWFSPNQAIDVYGPGYWRDLNCSIDNDLNTFAYEEHTPALRPVEYSFDEAYGVQIHLAELHNIKVEYPYFEKWYTLHEGPTDFIMLKSVYPLTNIRITSCNPNEILKISEVYVPEPMTIAFLMLGLLIYKTTTNDRTFR